MSKLPLELIAEICELLHADCEWPGPDSPPLFSESKAALNACSLVCWAWNVVAQQHLFRSITYSYRQNPAETNEVAACVDEENGRWDIFERGGRRRIMPRKSFTMFVAFLDQHPHIRPYIRHLELICHVKPVLYDGKRTLDPDSDATDDPVSLTDFTRLLQLLPRLQYLVLEDFTIDHTVNEYEFGGRIQLQRLSLTWTTYLCTASDLAVVLKCFSSIAELRIEEFSLVPDPGPVLWPAFHARSSVEVQYLYVFHTDRDVNRLNELVFACNSLRCLDVSVAECIIPPKMEPMLAHVESTLQELAIVFPCVEQWGYQDDTFIDLSSCTHLHNVTLGIPLLGFFFPYPFSLDGQRYGRALSELQRTLQSISGPLRAFTLNIGVFLNRDLSKRFLRAFISGMAGLDISLRDLAHQHGLRRVKIEYFAPVPQARHKSWRELLVTVLPSLAQAGLLDLVVLKMHDRALGLYGHWDPADGTDEAGRWWE